jgi:hypothetical protein
MVRGFSSKLLVWQKLAELFSVPEGCGASRFMPRNFVLHSCLTALLHTTKSSAAHSRVRADVHNSN